MSRISGYLPELLPEKLHLGTLEEIPEISINAFSNSQTARVDWDLSRAFFLTHLEEDLLKDFLNASFLKRLEREAEGTFRVYMHPMTFRGVLFWARTHPYVSRGRKEGVISLLHALLQAAKIVLLRRKRPFRLRFSGGPRYPLTTRPLTIEVTPLSAGHSPGSIMLLLDRISGPKLPRGLRKPQILYTGNCRVSVDELQRMEPLYDRSGHLRPLTSLYADTFHCALHVRELPFRSHVELRLLLAIQAELKRNPDARFELWTPFCLSSLNFLSSVAATFGERIHVPPPIRHFCSEIPALALVTTAEGGEKCRFHYGCRTENRNQECCPDKDDFQFRFDVFNVVFECDMFPSPVAPTEDECSWNTKHLEVYFKEPDLYRCIYASNFSRYELARVVNFLRVHPKKVKPLHRPKFMKTKHVRRLLQRTCEEVGRCAEGVGAHPSHLYDLTGEEEEEGSGCGPFFALHRPLFHHIYPPGDLGLFLGEQGDHSYDLRINLDPDPLVPPPIHKMDLSLLPPPRHPRLKGRASSLTTRPSSPRKRPLIPRNRKRVLSSSRSTHS